MFKTYLIYVKSMLNLCYRLIFSTQKKAPWGGRLSFFRLYFIQTEKGIIIWGDFNFRVRYVASIVREDFGYISSPHVLLCA